MNFGLVDLVPGVQFSLVLAIFLLCILSRFSFFISFVFFFASPTKCFGFLQLLVPYRFFLIFSVAFFVGGVFLGVLTC